MKVKPLSCVWLLATPWTAAYQAPPSMGVSRQEYWSGVPSPSLEKEYIYIKLNCCAVYLKLIWYCKKLQTIKKKWYFNSTDLKTKKWLTSFGHLLHRYYAKCLHILVTKSQKQFVRLVLIIPTLQLGKQKLKEINELAQVSSYCTGSLAFESIPFWLQ